MGEQDFHATLLAAIMKGLPISQAVYPQFEKVLTGIYESISQVKDESLSLTQWILIFTSEFGNPTVASAQLTPSLNSLLSIHYRGGGTSVIDILTKEGQAAKNNVTVWAQERWNTLFLSH